ncbi:hypothetical protein ACHAXT_008339 [Thalassiosira profunda]
MATPPAGGGGEKTALEAAAASPERAAAAVTMPSSQNRKPGGNDYRRRKQNHELALWWMPENGGGAKPPPAAENNDGACNEFSRDGMEVHHLTSLAEGENWVACSFAGDLSPASDHANNDKPLEVSIIKGRRSRYLDRGRIKGGGAKAKALAGAEESLAEEDRGGQIAVLCIDVDNDGHHVVAVKDVRLGSADDHRGDAECKRVEGLEFFIARRRPREQPGKEQPKVGDKASDEEDKGGKKEDSMSLGSGSEDEGTSGYGTDDEQDANDEVEEMNERSEVRFCNSSPSFGVKAGQGAHLRSAPSREVDVDKEGNHLYHLPEPLRRRQLRVLNDGDRILMRYWSPGHKDSSPPCAKLEYLYGQHQQERLRKAKAADDEKGAGEAMGKPRLMSVKSADVKSYEKKKFVQHDTSAADAPTAGDDMDGDGRKAGEDWSDPPKHAPEKGGKKDKKAEEEDMDEYSYLTGEVMIKDQDYISAVTGDETGPSASALVGGSKHKHKLDDGGDAATASAVVLGVTSPRKKANEKEDGPVEESEGKAEDDSENAAEDDSKPGDGKKENGVSFAVEAVEEAKEGGDNEDVFLTAKDKDTEDEEEEHDSGEELLSQPNEAASPMKFELAEPEEEGKGNDESEESETDISKTQPLAAMKNPTKYSSFHSFSSVEEKMEEMDDDDDSTECPEEEDKKLASDENEAEKASSPLPEKQDDVPETAQGEKVDEEMPDGEEEKTPITAPAKLAAAPQSPEKEEAKEHASDGDESDHEATQKFPSAKQVAATPEKEKADGNQSDDESDHEATQMFPAAKQVEEPMAKADEDAPKKEDADDWDEENSDGEPTQGFPLMKPLHNDATANEHSDEDDDAAYNAATQTQDLVFQQETQALPMDSPHPEGGVDENDAEEAKDEPPEESSTPATANASPPEEALAEEGDDIVDAAPNGDGDQIKSPINSSDAQQQDANEMNDEPPVEPNAPAKANPSPLEEDPVKEGEIVDAAPDATNPDPEHQDADEEKEPTTADVDEGKSPTMVDADKGEEAVTADVDKGEETDTANDAVAKPAATKEHVHFELPSPNAKTSDAVENCGAQEPERELESSKPPHEEPTEQMPESKAAPPATYDDSAIQQQRLENSAVHRVSSGAIMTGPVGGACAFPAPPHQKREEEPRQETAQEPKNNLLVSYALQSNALNPDPAPDAAASSEETTVCQMDSTKLKKEQSSAAANEVVEEARNENVAAQEEEDAKVRNESGGDPNIPRSIEVHTNTRGGHGRHSSKGLTTPSHRSKRKRGVSSSGRRSRESPNEAVRIMFTGINPTRRHKQMISDIGAHLVDNVEDALTATHVIASDGKTKLRRTPKLMICVCKTSRILGIEWLEQSAKEQRALDTDDYLLLGDKEAEKRYDFTMKDTLEKGRAARLERGGVLGGWSVHIGSGVAGNNAPSAKELNLIVEATGATLLPKISAVSDPAKTIILTSDPCTDAQRSARGVPKAVGQGAKLLPTTWLFHTIITQQLSDVGSDEPAQEDSGKRRAKRKAPAKSSPAQGSTRKSRRKR